MLEAIFAQLENGAIGHKNKLIWSGPKYKIIAGIDMAFFKETTKDKNIVMGYKTWESLNCKKLPGRKKHYIITSRSIPESFDEDIQYLSLEDFRNIVKNNPTEVFMVIGGAQLYSALLPECDKIYQSILYIDKLNKIDNYDTYLHLNRIIDLNKYTKKWRCSDVYKNDSIDIYEYSSSTLGKKEKK